MRKRLVTLLLTVLAGLLISPVAFALDGQDAGQEGGQEGEVLRGTLRGPPPEREPVEGAEITVSQEGDEVGTATSGSDGSWEVPLPSAGRYDVTLDPATLPSEVVLRDPSKATLPEVSVRTGQQRAVIFQLVAPGQQEAPQPGETPGVTAPSPGGGGGGGFSIDVERILQLLVEGVKLGLIIAMTSVGLSLIFGTTGLINFAHGDLVTLGAVIAFVVNVSGVGGITLQIIPAAIIAILCGGLIGMALERGLWSPLRGRGVGLIQMFIISIGLSLVLRYLISIWFGSSPESYADYTLQSAWDLGPVSITPRDLAIVVLSVVVLVGVGLMLQKSRVGKAMRAVADNNDLAESSGINVPRVILLVWALGVGLATLGGIFYGLTVTVVWNMGFNLLLLMFAAVILGGLGTAFGAMAGGLVIGIVAQMSTLRFPSELQNAWALLVLILVLLVRPQGILGRRERVG